MLSGLQVLGSIDEALLRAQQHAGDLDRRLGELNDRLLQLRKEEGESYRMLARVRLSAPDNDQLIQRLTAIDGRVRAALQQQSSSTTEIDSTIAAIEAEAKALQAERSRATAVVDQRQGALRAAEDATRQRLEQTPAYQQQMRAAQQADQIAVGAEQKTQQAENDRREKGKPYEQDQLFQYLWKRSYGTSAYAAGPFTRMMDRWAARLCGYDKARADYAMLQEIPRRLAEHAKRQREEAQAEAQRLAEMRQTALQGDEETAAPRAAVAEVEKQVDAIDDKIEANGKKALDAFERRAAVTRGEDAATREAIEAIEAELRHQELRALRAEAQRTPTADDDAAIRRLEQLEAEETRLLAAIEQAKSDQATYRRQLTEIESIRRDYRRRGYNRGMFDSAGGALIGSLLGQLLGGAMSRDVFWDQVDQHRQPLTQPGRWGGDFGGTGGGDFGGAGGGDFGGEDFRTGGGF
jgi:DNA repair exonuclease SbcCD ATPase subunit